MYIHVEMEACEADACFLRREAYQTEVEPLTRELTAFDCYSRGAGMAPS